MWYEIGLHMVPSFKVSCSEAVRCVGNFHDINIQFPTDPQMASNLCYQCLPVTSRSLFFGPRPEVGFFPLPTLAVLLTPSSLRIVAIVLDEQSLVANLRVPWSILQVGLPPAGDLHATRNSPEWLERKE